MPLSQTQKNPKNPLTNAFRCGIILYVEGKRTSRRQPRESGGTGRRARLRGVWFTPYGFKSRLSHQYRKNPGMSDFIGCSGISVYLCGFHDFLICSQILKMVLYLGIEFPKTEILQHGCNICNTNATRKTAPEICFSGAIDVSKCPRQSFFLPHGIFREVLPASS